MERQVDMKLFYSEEKLGLVHHRSTTYLYGTRRLVQIVFKQEKCVAQIRAVDRQMCGLDH